MFHILRFYPKNKNPQALSSYMQKYYCWTTDPDQAIAFVTKDRALSAVADIRANSKTAKQFRFVVANVSEVPIGTYPGSSIKGKLSW